MTRAGRIAWRGLALRAHVVRRRRGGGRWVMAMPDVFSIRHTTVEDYLEPVVHEVKVTTRRPAARTCAARTSAHAYLPLSSECWYVLKAGIAEPDEIPPECGVLFARDDGALDVARPAPKRAMRLPLRTWMALARATPMRRRLDAQAQGWLGAPDEGAGSA